MKFKGNVDFSPKYKVVPGDPPGYFPPKVANPGAVADEQWSSIVVLPSGLVLNAQIVQNASGSHVRMKAIDIKGGTVTLSILDGVQGGKHYFYHLVTDASSAARRCSKKAYLRRPCEDTRVRTIHTGGEVGAAGLLAGAERTYRQGLGSGSGLFYSARQRWDRSDQCLSGRPGQRQSVAREQLHPLWDAHVSMWTPAAIDAQRSIAYTRWTSRSR